MARILGLDLGSYSVKAVLLETSMRTAAVRSFAEETGRKLGKVAQPLRAAVTGRSTSPGIFEVLEVLGRDESLARIGDQAHPDNSA